MPTCSNRCPTRAGYVAHHCRRCAPVDDQRDHRRGGCCSGKPVQRRADVHARERRSTHPHSRRPAAGLRPHRQRPAERRGPRRDQTLKDNSPTRRRPSVPRTCRRDAASDAAGTASTSSRRHVPDDVDRRRLQRLYRSDPETGEELHDITSPTAGSRSGSPCQTAPATSGPTATTPCSGIVSSSRRSV